ncbi:ATP-dependent 6-phosphofructokinase [Mycobacterium talmoniae]|uniref:ATP-dependent 6-phosphofructokinase n=1 Tax=Mycobacterium talmoniae TaxID=1858794 RepID=A0A2S8BKA7_9MYCO|nr:ATP-dependent 6-phosphofructokinase [Mycobacterium talmoniae]
MRIGVLTGGGDCPGLNAVIRAVVRTCDARYGSTVVGFQDGWRGLLENRRVQLYNDDRNDRLLAKGGTMLGTARVHPDKLRAGLEQVKQTLDDNGIDVLIPIGGEGTLTAAHWLSEENVPVVGVPKPSTTTSTAPTSHSATTPRCRSRPTPSTGCIPPPNPISG